MKTIISAWAAIIIIAFSFSGCENEKEDPKQLILTGKLVSHTGCKHGKKSMSGITEIPDTLSCIQYLFDNLSNKLIIKHINAGFNCCPDSLFCNVSLSHDTIEISEFEAAAGCHCNCLYDLDLVLNGVAAKKYHITFKEPYCGEQEKIIFEADLVKDKSGSFCVVRKNYPWGM